MKILIVIILTLSGCAFGRALDNTEYINIVGDGVHDDTVMLQDAITKCSLAGLTCVIPFNKKVRITAPIYIYGKASLIGESGAEVIVNFTDFTERYVFNLGISGKQIPETPFTGTIENIKFSAISGPLDKWQGPERTPISGRIIQFWRAKNATIRNNIFVLNDYFYGATSSQNNQYWLRGYEVKWNLTIAQNQIYQDANSHGMECIGIGPAENVLIADNKCVGAGDDLVGAHFVDGLAVKNNTLFGVDGRIFIADSTNVKVIGNHIERMASTLDGRWYRGATLIYLGYEDGAQTHTRPGPGIIEGNVLILPEPSLDDGALISVTGASDVKIRGNVLTNKSAKEPKGIWMSPWKDSSAPDFDYDNFYVENITIGGNKLNDNLLIYQTGQCKGYRGFIDILQPEIGGLSCPKVVNTR